MKARTGSVVKRKLRRKGANATWWARALPMSIQNRQAPRLATARSAASASQIDLICALDTGMRQGEIFSLLYSDEHHADFLASCERNTLLPSSLPFARSVVQPL